MSVPAGAAPHILAEITQSLPEDAGAQVPVVSDGRQAIKCFASAPAETFGVILMDAMMPQVNVLTATQAIRSLERPDAARIPIIAMTANAFADGAGHRHHRPLLQKGIRSSPVIPL